MIENIDITKLKRDYNKEPLIISRVKGKSEMPYKEDLEYLYIELNIPIKELVIYFNCSPAYITRIIKKYDIKKDKKLHYDNVKKTNLEKYGVEHPLQSKEVKEKMKQTCLEKYGCENVFGNKDIQTKIMVTKILKYNNSKYVNIEKAKQTNLERYGYENVFGNKDIQTKIKKIKLEKYGDENYNNRKKFKQTNLEKYDREYYTQQHISKESLILIQNKNLLEKYIKDNNILNATELAKNIGISEPSAARYIKDYNLTTLMDYSKSFSEKEIREYINQYYETENNTRKYLDGKEIDIFIPKLNIGIEFNGDFYHNENVVDKKYHQKKSLLAETKGIFIYHIFEYEWKTKKQQILNQLNNLLGINQIKIYARKCEIREVSNNEKSKFLESNHMQGNDVSLIKLGLYYNNELVSLMTFVKPRFNKHYEWELSRFCSKAGCNVIGGASKLFNYFVNQYKPESVISYSNMAHTKGNLYGMLGFTLSNIATPNYVWCKNEDIKTRYQCQKHKLLEQGYAGSSEVDIMTKRGYYRIYDCGNKVWVWNN